MYHGIINVYKEPGYTSHDVVARLRGILKQKKIGHTGTLDPAAEGVLPVCLGMGTRLCDMLADRTKTYEAVLLLGCSTDTQDTTGTILTENREKALALDPETAEKVILGFKGDYDQIPPMYSAVKIGGQKLYQIARRGGEIQRPARTVTVYELELLDQTGPGDYTLRIRCSKGTYVRTLCHDIGQALGCGGCMSSLRRTVAAGFTLEEAVTLDRVQEEGEALLAPLDSLFRQHPAYRIRHPRVDALCRNGNPFTVRQELPEGVYRVYGQSGEFLCLSRLEGGVMTSLKNFFGA